MMQIAYSSVCLCVLCVCVCVCVCVMGLGELHGSQDADYPSPGGLQPTPSGKGGSPRPNPRGSPPLWCVCDMHFMPVYCMLSVTACLPACMCSPGYRLIVGHGPLQPARCWAPRSAGWVGGAGIAVTLIWPCASYYSCFCAGLWFSHAAIGHKETGCPERQAWQNVCSLALHSLYYRNETCFSCSVQGIFFKAEMTPTTTKPSAI